VFTAEVVPLRHISHSKQEVTTDAQARINGATGGGSTSKVSNYQAGMEAEVGCFIVTLNWSKSWQIISIARRNNIWPIVLFIIILRQFWS
jgi:hypothetical protein